MTAKSENGKICYMEIPSADVTASSDFYQSVFGWSIRRRGSGAIAFDDGVGAVSGTWVTGRAPNANPNMIVYIMVDSAESVLEDIVAHGGKIIQPIGMDAPEITARFSDPSGNVFGLYQQP